MVLSFPDFIKVFFTFYQNEADACFAKSFH